MAMDSLGTGGNLMVIPPAQLEAQLQQQAKDKADATAPQQPLEGADQLVAYIRSRFEIFRNHRNTAAGWSERLLHALRTFNGQYDATSLQEIKKFGGSEIYARLIAQKCRGASSLLRDVYLGTDRPWGYDPPTDPDIPPEVRANIEKLMLMESQKLQELAQQSQLAFQPEDLEDRKRSLLDAARDVAIKRAEEQAEISEDKVEEILRQGAFYHALAEFLVDLPIFPFACLKGPVVKVKPEISWPQDRGPPSIAQKPRLFWYRVSPFDLWFTPGVADIEYADTIEKQRVTRGELNDMLDLPGYNTEAIYKVLQDYGRGGLHDNWDTTDAERATLESRENPAWNRSAMISMMEFNGNIQGQVLQEYGLAVPDPLRDYHVQVWCIGPYAIKAQLTPNPRMRHPYYITSWEKVPGTPVGNGLTDVLNDIQQAANATLRALVNNLAIASGPQVVVIDDLMDPSENTEEIFPWKRWHARVDPSSPNSGRQPVTFFQPNSNSQELLMVFKELSALGDDISAIPKYVTGQGQGSGASRTASGLAMLMGNSSKLLQTVSANIDRDVLEPALLSLNDLILLTDTSGMLTGEEKVSVQGVNVAIQRETVRQRQIEFLQATQNPMDAKLIGTRGRAAILRSVADTIGLPGAQIVPNDDKIEKMEAQQAEAAKGQPIQQAVQKGVVQGVDQATKAIVTQVIEAQVPQQIQEGAAPQPAVPPPGGPPGAPGGAPPGGPPGIAQAAAQAQGNQPPPPNRSPGPMVNAVGTPPKPGPRPPVAGPG